MPDIIQLGDLAVQVFRKDIRNIHLSVYPPEGRVVISCPSRHSLEKIRAYALAKLAWIRKQQRRFQAQQRESQRKYIERESHYIWGKRYLMCVATTDTAARIEQSPKKITLHVQPGATQEKREELYEDWMRLKLKSAISPLIAKWQPILGVNVKGFFVQRMKTKWGSCSPTRGTIRLNTELAKKPRQCLEYIVVHEMIHLLEPTHNERFRTLLDRFMPRWTERRKTLNSLPVRHEDWSY
jgi:predicted metal-dependent hydrolase